jgi:hypothetical protein
MSTLASIMTFAAATAVLATAAQAEGYTTRIETRPFYGAVVTLEEGVRVYRPLPPPRQVIINPGGRTPLALSFSDVRVDERSYNYHYEEESGSDGERGYGGSGFYGGFGDKKRPFHRGRKFPDGPKFHHRGGGGGLR